MKLSHNVIFLLKYLTCCNIKIKLRNVLNMKKKSVHDKKSRDKKFKKKKK